MIFFLNKYMKRKTQQEQINDLGDRTYAEIAKIQERLYNIEKLVFRAGVCTSVEVWPQVGDTIFRLNSQGDVIEDVWRNSRKQNNCELFLGVYKTEEEAKKVVEKVVMHRNNRDV